MDFLQLAGKTCSFCGLANRKSVAWHVGQCARGGGRGQVFVGADGRAARKRREVVGDAPSVMFATSNSPSRSARLAEELAAADVPIGRHGPFDRVCRLFDRREAVSRDARRRAFLRAMDISCYSLIALSEAFAAWSDPDASVVTISISTTRMASENYGYHGAGQGGLGFVAGVLWPNRSANFREFASTPSPRACLKTSASAGIPGYVDAYLYAEQATLRRRAVETEEVANVAAFLLEPAFQRHQRPAHRRRCRNVGELFRSRAYATSSASKAHPPTNPGKADNGGRKWMIVGSLPWALSGGSHFSLAGRLCIVEPCNVLFAESITTA